MKIHTLLLRPREERRGEHCDELVCPFVRLSADVSLVSHIKTLTNFLYMLQMMVARFCLGKVATCYVLPVYG